MFFCVSIHPYHYRLTYSSQTFTHLKLGVTDELNSQLSAMDIFLLRSKPPHVTQNSSKDQWHFCIFLKTCSIISHVGGHRPRHLSSFAIHILGGGGGVKGVQASFHMAPGTSERLRKPHTGGGRRGGKPRSARSFRRQQTPPDQQRLSYVWKRSEGLLFPSAVQSALVNSFKCLLQVLLQMPSACQHKSSC